VDWRSHSLGGEESVGEFEEGISPAVETPVECVSERAKGVKSIERIHDAPIMHSSAASRTLQPSAGLKRKLRGCMKSPQTRASRLVMRRLMAAYTNASPLAHNLL
jgi:hypothetical protein